MARTVNGARAAARIARGWASKQRNRRAVARFGEFWTALQRVGEALSEAEKAAKQAQNRKSGAWRPVAARHWELATAQEIRVTLRTCRSSLRVVSQQAKKFEPELIAKEWRR